MAVETKNFPLTQYYVVASFLATTAVGLLLGWLMTHELRADLLNKAKQHAVSVIEHLQDDIQQDYIGPRIARGEFIDPEDPAQYKELNEIVLRVSHSFGIRDVYIFDQDGRILYSTQADHVGASAPKANKLFAKALNGEVASAVRSRGSPLDMSEPGSGKPTSTALLETYVPVHSITERYQSGQSVSNVIEVYQDIDAFQKQIAAAQARVAIAAVLGGLFLFGILIWIVRYADRLIRERTDALMSANSSLTQLSQDLEQEVDRRTRELIQREKLASLGTLAAGLAHEVNNPLATVATCAQALLDRIEQCEDPKLIDYEDFREYLRIIEEESFRVKGITRNLLDFSRQQPEETSEEIDVLVSLRKTMVLLSVGNDLDEVQVKLPKTSQKIWGDPTTFGQLLFNLMKNAVDSVVERAQQEASTSYQGCIEWRLESHGDMVNLFCIDNGIGFKEEHASELAEPFFTTKRAGQGTGLGLALCHSMVERMQGRLQLESPGPNLGAVVHIELPKVTT